MAISLINLENINQTIQSEHAAWLKANMPTTVSLPDLQQNQYGILNKPQLWSGLRIFETKIKTADKNSKSAFEIIQEQIKNSIKEHKEDPAIQEELKQFAKKYRKYVNFIKQRSLLLSINQTVNDLTATDDNKVLIQNFNEVLSDSFTLAMQTRYDCLQAYKKVSIIAAALRAQTDKTNTEELSRIKQLEVLSKRLLDIYYEHAKKMTIRELFASYLSTSTFFIGLVSGVAAAVLGILGIFFPPLLFAGGILGMMSFISYGATIISALTMTHDAIEYGRSPDSRDLKWLLLDTVLIPFYVIGGRIFASIFSLFGSSDSIGKTLHHVNYSWNEIIGNVFPDVIDTQETVTDMFQIGSEITQKGRLKNTSSATSFQKIRSALAKSDNEAFSKIANTKRVIAKSSHETAIHGRDFAYVQYTADNNDSLPVTQSYHGHILLWDAGFIGRGASEEANRILVSVKKYKELKPDTPITERISVLDKIIENTNTYLTKYKDVDKKGRYKYVEKLQGNAEKERDNLQEFILENKDSPVVLVGFKYQTL